MRQPPADNVYNASAAPSLAKRDLLELWVAGVRKLDATIAWLKARRAGLTPPVVDPPAPDDPEPAEWEVQATPEERRLRRTVPQRVRWEVWRRDRGECVRCGSRKRLEFDHIIPFSKGGSNTARNIELLCEACNRSKGARVAG